MIDVITLIGLCKNVKNDGFNEIVIVNENGYELYCFKSIYEFYSHPNLLSFGKLFVRYFLGRYHYLLLNVYTEKDV